MARLRRAYRVHSCRAIGSRVLAASATCQLESEREKKMRPARVHRQHCIQHASRRRRRTRTHSHGPYEPRSKASHSRMTVDTSVTCRK